MPRPARLAGALLALLLAVGGWVPPDERGAPVLEVTGENLDGSGPLSSRAFAEKVVVIDVWGSWCPPCRKEAPDLQAASEETAAVAQFLGITTRDRQLATAQASSASSGSRTPPSTTLTVRRC